MRHKYGRQEAETHAFREPGRPRCQKWAKILFANVESNETTTIDNDLQFEIPLVEVEFVSQLTFKVRIGFGLTKTVQHLKTCLVDIAARPKLINEDYLKPQENVA